MSWLTSTHLGFVDQVKFAPHLHDLHDAHENLLARQERGLGSPVGSDDLEVTTDAWTTAVYGPQGCDKKPPAVSLLTPSHLGFVDQVKFAPHGTSTTVRMNTGRLIRKTPTHSRARGVDP